MATKPKVKVVTGPIVRYVDQTSASIWVEVDEGASVFGEAKALTGKTKGKVVRAYAHTNPVNTVAHDGAYARHYAIVRFEELKPSTLYAYSLTAAYDPNQEITTVSGVRKSRHRVSFDLSACAYGGNAAPAFRTLAKAGKEALRVAFGSCRNLDGGYNDLEGRDALADYSDHLETTHDDRLTAWPSLLLLMGDQVYCDDVAQRVVDRILEYRSARVDAGLRVPKGLKNSWSPDFSKIKQHVKDGWLTTELSGYSGFHCMFFEEWALLYETAWNEPEVRRLLANIPTFMMPDDHELANCYDITGSWREQMNADPDWRAALEDGMLAYWLYQGWGNASKSDAASHPILSLIERALVGDMFGEPANVGKAIQRQLDRHLHAPAYYTIPTEPPIIVLDARTDREFVAPVADTLDNGVKVVAHRHPDDMILSATQFTWLEAELQRHDTPFVATSVPFLQTLIGDRLLINGTRVLPSEWPDHLTSQDAVDVIECLLVRQKDAETWYAWPRSVEKLLSLISTRRSVVVLTGDVHYSYLYDTGDDGFDTGSYGLSSSTRVVQAVSSPLRYPMKQERIDGLEEFGGLYKREKDATTGEWDVGWPQLGNAEHELRETFALPLPVFPNEPDDAWSTFHDGRYTLDNLIATFELKDGRIGFRWMGWEREKLAPVAEYTSSKRL